MNRKKRSQLVHAALNQLFPNPKISLHYKDPFTLLVAVLLSAQCTDERVNKVTPLLFAKASTPKEMIKLRVDEIQEIIFSCGLSLTKARAIKETAQILVERFGSEVPNNFTDLESLPGVGHKTASVVLAQGFSLPAFPVDTHIFRVARRWGLSQGKTVTAVEKDLKKLFAEKEWATLHLQMILFARQYCPAKNHNPARCPICSQLSAV